MNSKLFSLVTAIGLSTSVFSQVEVDINFDMKHTVGGKETFDRNKYIVLHADATENDYNDELGKLDSLINLYDAYYGRETGRMRFTVDQVRENANRPGFADPASIAEWGTILNNSYADRTSKHPFEKGTTITAAQDAPFFPNGRHATGQGWFFSETNSAEEPFASATGQFMGLFMQELYGEGGTTGAPRPEYVEVINEPFFPLIDFASAGEESSATDIFEMHKTVADSVRKYSPESKIGGFTNAFPDLEAEGFEAQNKVPFGQWEERWRRFIDEVGPQMDFYSIHLYDFHSIGGKEQLRKGSNMEATMDMIEHYNTLQYGEVKPWVISEYGGQLNDFYAQPWSPARDWLILKSFSSMMMQFMERPDVIEKTVPFALGKAEFLFGEQAEGFAYPWRMMRKKDEPASRNSDEYVFTDVVKFYQLWSDVNGTRVDTKSTDLDILVDAYVDTPENKAYLILNSLAETNLSVNLNEFGLGTSNVTGVKIKHLFLGANNVPVLDITESNTAPESVVVNEEGTLIIEYTFDNAVAISETSTESKTYATTYKQAIVADQAISFTIPNITLGTDGEALLRLGVGRTIDASRVPVVTVNGTPISVPTDYRGDVQTQRDSFFGILEIPVPFENLVSGNNEVTVSFNDDGGFISSVALQTFDFSREVTRTPIGDRERSLTFDNIADFTPAGEAIPAFTISQNINLSLSYTTGLTDGVEEDLTYIAAQIRQVDELGNAVATSEFITLAPGEADNAGVAENFTYKIPTNFATPNTDLIPTTENLPEGHKLFLLLFMSVDGDTNFANANTEIVINEVPDRERSLTFDNIADFIPAGGTLPTVGYGQEVTLQLTYATGLTDRVEEDLFYIATQVRQIDADGNIIGDSTFTTILPDDAPNSGTVNFTYTIPTEFETPAVGPIPTTAELPEGHQLVLLIFMSTENNTLFANANTSIVLNAAADRTREITFDNLSEYIPSGSSIPVFEQGQIIPTTLTYTTGVNAGVEEDLSYVAMQVRQLDENFNIVNTSTFQAVVGDDAVNSDTVSFDYTLPTTFDDGEAIPLSADLPTGHSLFLLTFMSVDGDAGFADANTQITIIEPQRRRAVTFDNKSDYMPSVTSLPTFEQGQTIPTTLTYSTGLNDDETEEDLTYIAMQVRQFNENFAVVNTSTFEAVVSGDDPNTGTVDFDYTLPTTFDDDTVIPLSSELPEGHKLFLLIFMSVDGDTGFADANTEIEIILANRERTVTFDNVADYVSEETSLPTFDFGQTFSTTLSYTTGIFDNETIEDLDYVAMQLRQIDQAGGVVNISAFEAVVTADAENKDTVTFDYTLPVSYESGDPVLDSENLPDGHKLELLIFMQVDGGAGFANADGEIFINEPEADRERTVTIGSLDAFIPEGGIVPTFVEGDEFSVSITYNTAEYPNRIEDVSSLSIELRQVDQENGVVNTVNVGGNLIVDVTTAPNENTVTVDFTLPTIYNNGDPVLVSEALPDGHSLVLAAKLGVDNDTAFSEVQEEISIERFIEDREAFITWNNRDEFVSGRRNFPVFFFGETVNLNLSYSTPIVDGIEEELESVRARIVQVNRKGKIIRRTRTARILTEGAPNIDTRSVAYTLPTQFNDGRLIPNLRRLPRGHRLRLILLVRTKESKRVATTRSTIGFLGFNYYYNNFSSYFGAKTLDSNDSEVSLYPNPAHEAVIISNATAFKTATLIGLNGAVISSINLTESDSFNVSQLSDGIYIIKLFGEDAIERTLKIVVKH
ncbi:T9SS type A sorting domain-containing protein [Aquimarina agarivorans]|uniref:T9SS type A sorting domain-containing protein n=1 Tax=Aquimarina agarivorans TaxID=980584 RepID=UPI000248E704|nr:T9SS type A sorting domain-containing protein [Aquimarina agarivorans]